MRQVIVLVLIALACTGCTITSSATEKTVVLRNDTVSVDSSSVLDCCQFLDQGQAKTCAVLAGYDCSHCEEYCRATRSS
jgi:hypothetical protein